MKKTKLKTKHKVQKRVIKTKPTLKSTKRKIKIQVTTPSDLPSTHSEPIQVIPQITQTQTQELTKKGTFRKRKPKTSNIYFTEDTENAIIEYTACTDQAERNRIYNERIDYAFHKLTENIIHTFKFYYTDINTISELQHEVVTFLLSKLHLYQKSKGKAYSYFGTIAKRYLIIYNEKNYNKLKDKAELTEVDDDKKIFNDLVRENETDNLSTFMDLFIRYIDLHLFKLFPKQQDAKTADAIMELFKKRESLDVFNKKALFIYTREMINVTTPQITKIIKKLKDIYRKLFNIYYRDGDIDISKIV